jgi:hypothetical protein
VEQDIHEIHRDVKDLASTQKQEQIDRWLSPPDPSTNYNNALKLRQEGTGIWFLESNSFEKWKNQEHSFLWLHGIPGCGKTILSSTIIKHLEGSHPHKLLLYFYFDFNDSGKQTLDNVVRSFISQLYRKRKETQTQLDVLFSSCENGRRQPSCESLCKVLLQMIDQVKEVWIVLDALDECRTRKGLPVEGLLSWIRVLLDLDQRNVHLLVTSRPEQDIKSVLSEIAHKDDVVPIQSDLVSDDIRRYIRAEVREGNGLKRWRSHPDILGEIETQLMEKADGMYVRMFCLRCKEKILILYRFRWAACQIDTLEDCLNYRTLKDALASLPETLDETYSRILQAIPSNHKSYAIRILQFLTYTRSPLSIEELVDAIAVDTEGKPYFDPINRMPDPEEISRYCSSLVMVSRTGNLYDSNIKLGLGQSSDDKSKPDNKQVKLQLAHFSVKEYLTSNRLDSDIAQHFQELTASASIARVCLAYLLHFDEELPSTEVRIKFPLAQYSATFWTSFAAVAEGEDEKLLDLIKRLFCFQEMSYKICYNLYSPDQPWKRKENRDGYKQALPLYHAAFGGLRKMLKLLLDKGADVNAHGGRYGNALQAASSRGHEQIVKLLLDKGADVNALGGSYGNALYAALKRGHEQIVKLLLDKGADVNAHGGSYGNALYAASERGHEQIVKLLLDKGADVNAHGGHYRNALQAALAEGHEQIVKLLLNKGATLSMQNSNKSRRVHF